MKISTLFTLAAASFIVVSCTKARLNRETTSSEDNAIAQAMWDDVGNQAEGSAVTDDVDSDGKKSSKWNNCAEVTVSSVGSAFPKTVTLDFGSSNCTGTDGRERRGKLIYTISDKYRNTGSTITVTTDNYYVNDYKVEGTRTVKNEGLNSSSQLYFSISVQEASVTSPEGDVITWNSERTRTWVVGAETGFFTSDGNGGILGIAGILDDEYEIEGTADGIDRNGRSYTAQITAPLRVELDCRYVTEGVLELSPEDLKVRVVDYGDGECDNEATVEIGNNTYEITLKG